MPEYVRHEKDTLDVALGAATEALTSASMCNRFFVFWMGDRMEIVFGNSRHLTIDDATGFCVKFENAVSMNLELAEVLRDELTNQIALIKQDRERPSGEDG